MKLRILSLLLLVVTAAAAEEARPWTVFYATPLKAAIEPLAQHRRAQGYTVELIEAGDGYLEKVKAAKGCVILAGALDAQGAARADCVLPGGKGVYRRMEGRASDGILASDANVVGRLPAGSPEEMAAMVAKILRFEQEGQAADRKIGCIIGNPIALEKHLWPVDVFMAFQANSMLVGVNREWKISGAADLCLKPFPQSDAAFDPALDQLTAGSWEVLSFFGHSDPMGLYSTGSTYLLQDVWSPPQGPPRGIFFTCGCHALANQNAYAVRAMRSPSGPAAVIGASAVSYSTIGYLAGKGLAACAAQPEGPATAGDWWLTIRGAINGAKMSKLVFKVFDTIDGTGGSVPLEQQREEHLQMWSLLGDPAMRMPVK
ncbi:C25 family cysteine peptidase [Haloferula sp. BvORR071]|uniref:C25 family cysteine peptidase n=1 Tax=Haloferula sp. BvORR071 TaxID=1396141 RepID=UPI002240F570|nr:C25 family cysteine peptidase [Haloferula sp. BvORR071]